MTLQYDIIVAMYHIPPIWVTITSVHMGQSPIQTVPACPIQIRAHHHINVYIDINDFTCHKSGVAIGCQGVEIGC